MTRHPDAKTKQIMKGSPKEIQKVAHLRSPRVKKVEPKEGRMDSTHSIHELKPDESRLLTEEEMKSILLEVADRYYDAEVDVNVGHTVLVKAQDVRTASIKEAEHYEDMFVLQSANADALIRQAEWKEAECQARVERIFEEMETRWETLGLDSYWWQALKRREGDKIE